MDHSPEYSRRNGIVFFTKEEVEKIALQNPEYGFESKPIINTEVGKIQFDAVGLNVHRRFPDEYGFIFKNGELHIIDQVNLEKKGYQEASIWIMGTPEQKDTLVCSMTLPNGQIVKSTFFFDVDEVAEAQGDKDNAYFANARKWKIPEYEDSLPFFIKAEPDLLTKLEFQISAKLNLFL